MIFPKIQLVSGSEQGHLIDTLQITSLIALDLNQLIK